MSSKFGILAKLGFLQDWISTLIAGVNPAVIHNLEKYHVLKKVHYLSAIENVEGDYLEFGVFTGSSFSHSIRCCQKMQKLNPKVLNTKFYGFDSFSGFGEISEEDVHPFYTDENFSTSLKAVEKRVSRAARNIQYQLVPGFFSDSLRGGPVSFGIQKARIIFIDSDTYSSANEALIFCSSIIQEGAFMILDDFYSYRGSSSRGVAKAFNEFIEKNKLQVRRVFTYGMGGAVFIISKS
ncbi:hypothetical protein ICN17_01390 [Polynucleobacter sp. 73C-SIWE]|uniref:TylF/MycF/NovP-related O-methyltransferase n=1 Tax=Polynucleobacter sp. 73C-SIWE TaxID=2689098 RepID=UPI001C0CA1D7|nr:TylF/MycF/NovP-related O-methyltransferase [Polynucleobacter sp. 73C-SIWE]MBU3578656.1 hypothetical protein [Polynucleobacter sp. 73C-SIWE]